MVWERFCASVDWRSATRSPCRRRARAFGRRSSGRRSTTPVTRVLRTQRRWRSWNPIGGPTCTRSTSSPAPIWTPTSRQLHAGDSGLDEVPGSGSRCVRCDRPGDRHTAHSDMLGTVALCSTPFVLDTHEPRSHIGMLKSIGMRRPGQVTAIVVASMAAPRRFCLGIPLGLLPPPLGGAFGAQVEIPSFMLHVFPHSISWPCWSSPASSSPPSAPTCRPAPRRTPPSQEVASPQRVTVGARWMERRASLIGRGGGVGDCVGGGCEAG